MRASGRGRAAFLYFRRFASTRDYYPRAPSPKVLPLLLYIHHPSIKTVSPRRVAIYYVRSTTTTSTRILRKINNVARFIVVGSRAYFSTDALGKRPSSPPPLPSRLSHTVLQSTFNIIFYDCPRPYIYI